MFRDLVRSRLAGIAELSEEQIGALEGHYELLRRWNRRLNLTSISGLEEAVERHYCESLFLASRLPPARLSIVDVGSGAGFPGFPVAVFRPDWSVTLIESDQRKAVFLREASRALPNVRVLSQRAKAVAEPYDHAVSRAVSYEDLAPFLKDLAKTADLLTGPEEPPASLGFGWAAPVPIPWGRRTFLRIGRRL